MRHNFYCKKCANNYDNRRVWGFYHKIGWKHCIFTKPVFLHVRNSWMSLGLDSQQLHNQFLKLNNENRSGTWKRWTKLTPWGIPDCVNKVIYMLIATRGIADAKLHLRDWKKFLGSSRIQVTLLVHSNLKMKGGLRSQNIFLNELNFFRPRLSILNNWIILHGFKEMIQWLDTYFPISEWKTILIDESHWT